MSNHREALRQFLGAYFHQDWPEEYATADDAVDAFVTDTSDEDAVLAVAGELRALAATHDDDALAAALEDLGCSYDPSGDDLTHRAWVDHVITRLGGA